jgi:hypothetical protein
VGIDAALNGTARACANGAAGKRLPRRFFAGTTVVAFVSGSQLPQEKCFDLARTNFLFAEPACVAAILRAAHQYIFAGLFHGCVR